MSKKYKLFWSVVERELQIQEKTLAKLQMLRMLKTTLQNKDMIT